jgi:hypothetical protein
VAASSAAVGARMSLRDEIQGEPTQASTQLPIPPGIDATSDDAGYCCSAEGPPCARSIISFSLPSAWRKRSHRLRGVSLDGPGKLAKSNAEQVARAQQIVGKAPLSDDDQWPLCANAVISSDGLANASS